jgi:16S rRNA pseudouridine516 synthase
MFEAVDNKIETLERVTFGPLTLDPTLSRGEWRYLTDDEIALLQSGAKGVDAL